MNLLLKKQFILEALDYNSTLPSPFIVSYISPPDYYIKTDYLSFNQSTKDNLSHTNQSSDYYRNIVEKHISSEMTYHHHRKLSLQGNDFIIDYFKHFFITHPDLQLDLLKFYSNFIPIYTLPCFQFLTQFNHKDVQPLLKNTHHWLSFNTHNVIQLHDFMSQKDFPDNFIISVLKNYVSHNLKTINKTPSLSKDLEGFLIKNYPQSMTTIASNVTAIESNFQAVDEQLYQKSFGNHTIYCLTDHIVLDNLLKTFQILGWNRLTYSHLIHSYHSYLSQQHDFDIQTIPSQNQKQLDFYIKMKTPDYTLDDYKHNLFVLLSFYRNKPDYVISLDNFSQIFFHQHLNNTLVPHDKKQKTNKI